MKRKMEETLRKQEELAKEMLKTNCNQMPVDSKRNKEGTTEKIIYHNYYTQTDHGNDRIGGLLCISPFFFSSEYTSPPDSCQ